MKKVIPFYSGGMLGDFIHQLNVVKVICEREDAVADLYIVDDGDVWRYGAKKALEDMSVLISWQPYINSFQHSDGYPTEDYINLNTWRVGVAKTHAETSKYNTCWTELMAKEYSYEIPKQYSWMVIRSADTHLFNKTVIHRSKHRHNYLFDWEAAMHGHNCVFVTCDKTEWELFPFKYGVDLHVVKNITDMAKAIGSANSFIGNQSAPFAIACALDVPRLVELDTDPAPFYIGEEKYSNNIKWFLNNEVNNL